MRAILLALLLTACGAGVGTSGISELPAGTPLAAGKVFGYFGDDDTQNTETADHVNLMWVWAWGDWESKSTQRLLEARVHGIDFVVMGFPYAFEVDAEARTRAKFLEWQQLGVLSYLKAATPCDEPDTVCARSAAELRAWGAMVKRVAAEFPESAGLQLAIVYANTETWPALEIFDIVAWDDYPKGVGVLGDPLARLKRAMDATGRTDQKILTIPAAADGYGHQDIGPFFVKTETDPRLWGILVFTYITTVDEAGVAHRGVRVNGLKKSYCEAGRKIKFPGNPNPICI